MSKYKTLVLWDDFDPYALINRSGMPVWTGTWSELPIKLPRNAKSIVEKEGIYDIPQKKKKNPTKKGMSLTELRREYKRLKIGQEPSKKQSKSQANAKKAMNLYHSGKANSLKEAWAMVKGKKNPRKDVIYSDTARSLFESFKTKAQAKKYILENATQWGREFTNKGQYKAIYFSIEPLRSHYKVTPRSKYFSDVEKVMIKAYTPKSNPRKTARRAYTKPKWSIFERTSGRPYVRIYRGSTEGQFRSERAAEKWLDENIQGITNMSAIYISKDSLDEAKKDAAADYRNPRKRRNSRPTRTQISSTLRAARRGASQGYEPTTTKHTWQGYDYWVTYDPFEEYYYASLNQRWKKSNGLPIGRLMFRSKDALIRAARKHIERNH